jgi:hypothetical protein
LRREKLRLLCFRRLLAAFRPMVAQDFCRAVSLSDADSLSTVKEGCAVCELICELM